MEIGKNDVCLCDYVLMMMNGFILCVCYELLMMCLTFYAWVLNVICDVMRWLFDALCAIVDENS